MTAQRQVVINGPSIGWIATILGIVFIVLKLVGVIAWSWWWVLSPFWLPTLFVIVIFGLTFASFAIANAELKRSRNKRFNKRAEQFLVDRNTKRAGR